MRNFLFQLMAAMLLLSATAFAADPAQSQWVHPGPDGKLVYKTTPQGDRIMDFSYAGYMGGGVALPEVPVKITVEPSGNNDDTTTIQSAIDKVAAMPLVNGFRGAVLLAPGTYPCAGTISINASGVVLRGSGSGKGEGTTSTIKMIGGRHGAIAISGGFGRGGRGGRGAGAGKTGRGGRGGRRGGGAAQPQAAATPAASPTPTMVPGQTQEVAPAPVQTSIADAYVPSGAMSLTVADAKGFTVGDTIQINRPVTEAWVHLMQMDNLTRDGRPRRWISTGDSTSAVRQIAAIDGNKLTLDVPLSDSFDAKYLNPPGSTVVKIRPPAMVSQSGVEHLHIKAPPMLMSYQQAPYTALRINGQDCWARDVFIEETMNSVGVGGRRITLERVAIDRTVPNLGASKPAEFAPNGGQVLLDRCSSNGDNIWHIATGGGQAGPIVVLNSNFGGKGHIEGHMRWTTGMLLDNCRLPDGGIDLKNRGAMGSGHGWGMGWSVAWNCTAKSYVVQMPPGAANWMIGCIGPNNPTARPFDTSPTLPLGIMDASGTPVAPRSLYLAQLAERLGPQALKNIGYSPVGQGGFAELAAPRPTELKDVVDKDLGKDLAAHKLVNANNVRAGQFAGEMAVDGDDSTWWATRDGSTQAQIELDLEDPTEINTVELKEALGERVQTWVFEGQVDSDWKPLAKGTTIGERKIAHFPKVTAWKVRLRILEAQGAPAIRTFGLFMAPEVGAK